MKRHGVRFQAPLGGTLHLARTNAFFLGGGKALMNAYYRAAEALGVEVAYDTEVVDLEMRRRALRLGDGASVAARGTRSRAKALVAACGRLRVEPRVAARGVGPARRQLHRARHAVQHGPGAEAAARPRARSR